MAAQTAPTTPPANTGKTPQATQCHNRLLDARKTPSLTTLSLLERIALALERQTELQHIQNLRLNNIAVEIAHHGKGDPA